VSASGRARGDAGGSGNADASNTGDYSAGGSGNGYVHGHGRRGRAFVLCPVARLGAWSGFKAGGCAAVSFRFEAFTFELETQLLYGGVTHAFDWTLPLSFDIPLGGHDSLFDGPYLRFGGSPVGATFAHRRDGGSFVRFGIFAGGGYELELSRAVTFRVFDLRLSLDMGTARAMDRRGHWLDPGLVLGTGLVF
jgi:hypothetical protein